jgi:hypothetical protein
MEMDVKTLRALEGLGYVAAVMIGVGGLVNNEATKIFNVLGLVFAVIVIVRLMVMQILYGNSPNAYRDEEALDSELDSLADMEQSDEGVPPAPPSPPEG